VHKRLPPGGALLVAEKLLDDDRSGPPLALLQSLNILVCTEGKERTLGEHQTLLCEAEFPSVEGRRTESPVDAIAAVRR
jgi:acetylserotonin N-methyltransferase